MTDQLDTATATADSGDLQVLPHHRCPLCGGPNGCAPAASGSFNTACWCRQANFSEELLAKVPPAERRLSCICARCAGFDATGEGSGQ